MNSSEYIFLNFHLKSSSHIRQTLVLHYRMMQKSLIRSPDFAHWAQKVKKKNREAYS
uniref:Uncharacterized protein n=1 Tax=Setaria italica TaxID=4555 RepID=K3ZFV2_SETIT